MICPKCGGKTTVKETRSKDDYTIRRRQCLKCSKTFITKESAIDWTEGYEILRSIYNENYNRKGE